MLLHPDQPACLGLQGQRDLEIAAADFRRSVVQSAAQSDVRHDQLVGTAGTTAVRRRIACLANAIATRNLLNFGHRQLTHSTTSCLGDDAFRRDERLSICTAR